MPPPPPDSTPFLIRSAEAARRLGRHVPGVRQVVDGLGAAIRNRTLIIPFGVGRGLRFCARGATAAHALGLAEVPIQRVLAHHLRPGDTFYDLGANVGFFTLMAARLVGPTGRVHAFEPSPTTAALLRANVARNGLTHVEVHECAVAATSGTAELMVAADSPMSRLAATPGPLTEAVEQIEVRTVALDDLIEAESLRPPTLLKIDVEGAEIVALQGMHDTITRHRPTILCELHGTGAAFIEAMRPYGYALSAVGPHRPIEGTDRPHHVLACPSR